VVTRQKQLRIAIDARYLSHGLVGGVHTYLRNLSLALLRSETKHEYLFWVDQKAPFELQESHPDVMTRQLPWRNGLSSVRNDMRIGEAMLRDHADLAHFPANYGLAPSRLPTVITIHDAINLLPLPEILKGHSRKPNVVATMTYLHFMTRRAVRDAPFVVTDSWYSRQEILNHSDLDPERVFVVHLAQEAVFQPAACGDVEDLRRRYGLKERVLLADAIKNPDCVLRAYRALSPEMRDRTSLVFFSRRPVPEAVERSQDSGESVVLLRPTQDELVALFSLADVFIFPSWYEGFGLPALEAMACGTPVIASSRGSLPEVVGDAGMIVDAEDHDAIAAHVSELLSDRHVYAIRREEALDRARAFSWDRSARQMLEIYGEIYERSRLSS
jgi:glycosyltransferase involved in cell wall biosynthesis